jgi:hypothetical protein
MPFTNVLTLSPYNKCDVPLGGIVVDARCPHADSIGETTSGEHVSVASDTNFTGNARKGLRASVPWLASMIVSIFWEAEWEHSLEVQTDEARIYTLLQPEAIFEELCAREQTQKWLYKRYKNSEKPLFVVGYRTLLNAKVVRNSHNQSSMTGKIQISPVFVSGPSGHDASEVEASASHHYGSKRTLDFVAQGERIFAICYRKIKFKFHTQVVAASLQRKNFWKPSSTRGNTLESETVMEALLEDVSDWSDHGSCTKAEVGDTIFVSLPVSLPEDDD